jgi:tRNA A-37 threonylcarbamoyl transferase component Bud32
LLGLGFGSASAQSAEVAATAPHTPPGRFIAPQPAELAAHFPQLEILELLGQGGMGAVYKARQRQLNRLVALKILPPEVARDPAFAQRFEREAQALAQLNHPQIVTVHDSGQANGLYFFVMEYVDGLNLRRMLAEGKLSPAEALAIVPQVCEALQYAHDEGVVHRDIKPENILLDRKGRVKIADFGLARLVGQSRPDFTLTGTQQVMGTPHYMAPEQMERPQAVDHRADIYSLGVVFYEMLTGELPLGRFQPPSKKVQVDVRLDEVVLRSLEKEPERRYQQASTIKTEVERIASQAAWTKPLPPPKRGPGLPAADVDAARDQVRIPAIGLIVLGVIQCVVFGLVVIVGLLFAGLFFARTSPRMSTPGPDDMHFREMRIEDAAPTAEETMQLHPVPPSEPRPTAVPEITAPNIFTPPGD